MKCRLFGYENHPNHYLVLPKQMVLRQALLDAKKKVPDNEIYLGEIDLAQFDLHPKLNVKSRDILSEIERKV